MTLLFALLSYGNTTTWLVVAGYFASSFVRTVRGRHWSGDTRRGAIAIAAVSVLLFQGRRLIFGAHLDALPVAEETYWMLAMAISIAAGALLIATDRRP